MGFTYTEEAVLTCSQNVQGELGAAAGKGRGGGSLPFLSLQSGSCRAATPLSPERPDAPPVDSAWGAQRSAPADCSLPSRNMPVWWQRATAGKPAKSAGAPGTLPGLSGAGSQCATAAGALFSSGGAKRRVHSRVCGLHVPPGNDSRRRRRPTVPKGCGAGEARLSGPAPTLLTGRVWF